MSKVSKTIIVRLFGVVETEAITSTIGNRMAVEESGQEEAWILASQNGDS